MPFCVQNSSTGVFGWSPQAEARLQPLAGQVGQRDAADVGDQVAVDVVAGSQAGWTATPHRMRIRCSPRQTNGLNLCGGHWKRAGTLCG
jgi:hypothetical protein